MLTYSWMSEGRPLWGGALASYAAVASVGCVEPHREMRARVAGSCSCLYLLMSS